MKHNTAHNSVLQFSFMKERWRRKGQLESDDWGEGTKKKGGAEGEVKHTVIAPFNTATLVPLWDREANMLNPATINDPTKFTWKILYFCSFLLSTYFLIGSFQEFWQIWNCIFENSWIYCGLIMEISINSKLWVVDENLWSI